jgi:hypothetical protein
MNSNRQTGIETLCQPLGKQLFLQNKGRGMFFEESDDLTHTVPQVSPFFVFLHLQQKVIQVPV